MARIEGIPGILLGEHREVDEPVGLQRLLEIARCMGRYITADVGNFFQLGAPLGIGLRGGHARRQIGMAFGEAHHGAGGCPHSF